MLKTTDNNCGNCFLEENEESDLKLIANKKIENLMTADHNNLLIFPPNLEQYGDKINEESIFTINDSILTTGNIMGFVGVNNSEITIQSRFAQDSEDNDYFLHYMLQKVFSLNIFDLKHGSNKHEQVFDFLLYLFPFYLKKALNQGLYKEYKKKFYNDCNIKGAIDINRQIASNLPFTGKIAYNVREYSYDNKITELIRHTIEFIKQHKFACGILSSDIETQKNVQQITNVTPLYDKKQRNFIISQNCKTCSHPYFSEYRDLQKICLQILRFESIKYGQEKDKIYGLLFDGAWLWEEYLNTLLSKIEFKHPLNKKSKGAIYLFEDKSGKRYPDFWKDDFILDAKYKRISDKKVSEIGRDDLNQIVSYMFITKAKLGGFISPANQKEKQSKSGLEATLNGYGGKLIICSLAISQEAQNFKDFCLQMEVNENLLLEKIKEKQNEILGTTR